MANVGDLVIKLKADAKDLEEGLKGAESSLKKTGDKMKGIGKKMSMGITAPIAGIGLGAIMTGANFEKGMNRVKALTGTTGAEFDALKQQAKDLGSSTAFTANQASEAMGFLAMAGFKSNDILGAMPGVLNLAAAAQVDLGEAADITSNILTGFGLEVSELGRVNDVLVKGMTTANVDLSQLGEAMKYVGPVAASAGMDFEETAAAIALLGNAGIQGSMAGTSLRGAMTKLLTPTEEAETIMKKLGLQMTDSGGNLLGFTEIVKQLEESGITTGDAMKLFGQRAGPGMMALVSQGSEALGEMTASLKDSGGTAQSIADVQMEGMAGAVTEMKSAFEGLMIALSEDLLPILTSLIDTVTPLIQKFANAPGPIKKIVLVVGILAAVIGPLLIVIGMMIPAITALSGVMAGLSLSMGPITLAIIGIAAAIAAGVLIWKNWDKIINTLKKTWDTVWGKIRSVFETVMNKVKKLYDSKLGWLLPGGALIKGIKLLRDNWETIWNKMKDIVKAVANPIISVINAVIGGINALFGALKKIKFGWEEKKKLGITVMPAFQFAPFSGLPTIPTIPKLAKGGIVNQPTLAMIGEAGPEAVIPLGRNGSTGTSIVVNITGPTYGFDDFEKKVSKAIRDGVRRGGFQGILNPVRG